MGNYFKIVTALAVILSLAYFFNKEFNSYSAQSNLEQKNLKSQTESSGLQSESKEISKRNIAQLNSENLPSTPRKMNFRLTNKITQIQPQVNELKEIQISDLKENWKLWPAKKVVTSQESNLSDSNFKVGNFVITDAQNLNQNLNEFSSQEPWVVFNERLNTVGILTGTISVKLNDPEYWDVLEKQFNLKLIHSFPDIGLFLVTSHNSRFDLSSTFESLKANPQVQKVELEIVSRNYVQ